MLGGGCVGGGGCAWASCRGRFGRPPPRWSSALEKCSSYELPLNVGDCLSGTNTHDINTYYYYYYDDDDCYHYHYECHYDYDYSCE